MEASKRPMASPHLPSLATVRARRDWRLMAAGIAVAMATFAFSQPLLAVVQLARTSDLFSYILLVPFASAFLLHHRAFELPRALETSWWQGGLALLLAAFAFLGSTGAITPHHASSAVDRLAWQMLAYYGLLLATGFLALGGRWMAAAVFPVFFLGFIIPWPDAMVSGLEFGSQAASAWAAHLAFEWTNMPVFRDGFVFELAGARIQVAQECSGIRSSVALILSGLLASNLLLRNPLHRAVVLALIIPVAIIRNGARIWLIAWLCVEYGPHMIHSVFHTHGGPVFFALSLLPVVGVLWLFVRREQRVPSVSGASR